LDWDGNCTSGQSYEEVGPNSIASSVEVRINATTVESGMGQDHREMDEIGRRKGVPILQLVTQ